MFSFLKSTGFVESTIDYRTKYSEISYQELNQLRLEEKKKNKKANFNLLEEMHIEIVLRSFDTILGMGADVSKERAKRICDYYLENNPYHVFFNFARGMLADSSSSKLKFLFNAASSKCTDKTLVKQAALELSKILFDEKKYLESQAWITYAVILGNEKARIRFIKEAVSGGTSLNDINEDLNEAFVSSNPNRHFSKYPSTYSLIISSVVASILSKSKLEFTKTNSKNGLNNIIYYASKTEQLSSALMLYEDSPLGLLACNSFVANEELFKTFFAYCADNNIISNDVSNLITEFIENYTNHLEAKKNSEIKTTLSSYASMLLPHLVINPPLPQTQINNQYCIVQQEVMPVNPLYYTMTEFSMPGITNNEAQNFYLANALQNSNMNSIAFERQFPSVPNITLFSNTLPPVQINRNDIEEKRQQIQYPY